MKPGNFLLGSELSRAAARRIFEQRRVVQRHFTVIMDIAHMGEPSCTPWKEGKDGIFRRVCCIPDGMTMEEAETIIAAKNLKANAMATSDDSEQ